MRILYISNATFPDKNAAAHRIRGNIRLFKALGFKTDLIANQSNHAFEEHELNFLKKFDPGNLQLKPKNQLSILISILKNWKKYDYFIFYNYPTFINIILLVIFPKTYKKKIILDITEWYETRFNFLSIKSNLKAIDVAIRNKFLYKFSERLITASEYYQKLISQKQSNLVLPTLFNKGDFNCSKDNFLYKKRFIYFGNPFSLSKGLRSEKEKIKLLADQIEKVHGFHIDFFGFSYEDFSRFYNINHVYKNVSFLGEISGHKLRKILPQYLASIVIRDDIRSNRVGFPGKLAESLMSSTPVLCSDIEAHGRFKNIPGVFLISNKSIAEKLQDTAFITKLEDIKLELIKKNNFYFDWRNFINSASNFLNEKHI